MATTQYTVVLNLQSLAFPNITNPIRVDVSTQANPTAIVATETDNVLGHPERIWSFPGLPRTNYLVQMHEIDAGGNKLNRLAYFDVVPNSLMVYTVHEDVQIKAGVTPGFDIGFNTFLFDGVNGRPDFRGWNINPERRNVGGTMERMVEYSWDKNTGELKMLTPGDMVLPGEFWNLDFDPIASPAGGSTSPAITNVISFTSKLITANYAILKEDFGNNLIVEPVANYIELTLPAVADIPAGTPLKINVHKASICCVKIVGTVVFPFGANIFLLSGESIEIYCFTRNAGNNEYRYMNASGNFDKVGSIIYADKGPLNSLQAVGITANTLTHARLWQFVNSLPASQKILYADWANNQTFFSLNSGNNFMIPNRSRLYGKSAWTTDVPGTYLAQQMVKHKHYSPSGSGPSTPSPFGAGGVYGKYSWKDQDSDNQWWMTNDGTEIAGNAQLNTAGLFGTENRPNSFLINQYILL